RRRRADVAGARADEGSRRLLLQRMGDPAGGAADREEREGGAARQTDGAAQRDEGAVDVRARADQRVDGLDERVARRVGRQQVEEGAAARIARLAIKRMAEAGEPLAALEAFGDDGARIAAAP